MSEDGGPGEQIQFPSEKTAQCVLLTLFPSSALLKKM